MNDYLDIKELYHHGIKGQRWGIRRYQNEDGTLTDEGKRRYFNKDGSMSNDQMNKFRDEWNKNGISSLQMIAKKENPNRQPESTGKNWDEAYNKMAKEIEKLKNGKKSILDDVVKTGNKIAITNFFTEYYLEAALKDYGLSGKEIDNALYALDESQSNYLVELNHVNQEALNMNDYLEIRDIYHSGIKGQKWGIRRYQNEDGTLTDAGKARYNKEGKKYNDPRKMSDKELRDANSRLGQEFQYRQLTGTTQPGKAFNRDTAVKIGSTFLATAAATLLIRKYKSGKFLDTNSQGKISVGKTITTAALAGGIGSLIAAAGSLGGTAQPLSKKDKGDS